MITPADMALIGRLIDGPADAANERALARRIACEPALARIVRRHLSIAEAAEQSTLPERSAQAFVDGWEVRLAADADAAVFTARTMLRIAGDRQRHPELVLAIGMRAAGLAAAALLIFALGWSGAAAFDSGRDWLLRSNRVSLDDDRRMQRADALRQLLEAQR